MIRVGTWNVLGLTGFRAQDAAAQLGPPGSEASTARWVEAFTVSEEWCTDQPR